jgi:hemerythrin-like domain-containing protein
MGEEVPEVLIDCHLRLRQVTTLTAELAAREAAPADEVRAVATRVQRYFTVALPLHEADEEQSLFPRLAARAPELASTIAGLRTDHDVHAARVGALLALCEELQSRPARMTTLRTELAAAARALEEAWRDHLATEEATLFPAVATALSAEDRAAIREEMRARRAHLPG